VILTMNSLFSTLARLLAASPALAPAHGVARNLMERAEADAGRDPHQAQELRSAASAYLSVIR
jgi:hypothetical protein